MIYKILVGRLESFLGAIFEVIGKAENISWNGIREQFTLSSCSISE